MTSMLAISISRLEGQHGAAALWEALRAYSRQKLVNKDALIMPDVKVQIKHFSHVLYLIKIILNYFKTVKIISG